MVGAVGVDVLNCLLDAVHHADGDDHVQVLGLPVLLGGFLDVGYFGADRLVAPHRHAVLAELLDHSGQLIGQPPRHQQGFGGVADLRHQAFTVQGHFHALLHVAAVVHEDVADAGEVFDDRYLRLLGDGLDQALAAAGNDHVDALVLRQQRVNVLVRAADDLDGVGG